ncbi:MAG: hypothetical protein DRR06_18535 [Gammaproteobacteria bacterium]|nr:MAG: hypothetical protein DRR06_18535 [Gammaproteobacteria bacterium]
MKYAIHQEIKVVVDYDFQPEEKQVLYPNDRAHPGWPAEITVNEIDLDGLDILPYIEESDLDRIKAEIMDIENTPPEER